jgi:hypothetical protein
MFRKFSLKVPTLKDWISLGKRAEIEGHLQLSMDGRRNARLSQSTGPAGTRSLSGAGVGLMHFYRISQPTPHTPLYFHVITSIHGD